MLYHLHYSVLFSIWIVVHFPFFAPPLCIKTSSIVQAMIYHFFLHAPTSLPPFHLAECVCACVLYIHNVLQMLNAKWHYSTRTIVVDDEEQPINLHSFNILDFSPAHTPDYHANDNLTLIFGYLDYLRYTFNEWRERDRKQNEIEKEIVETNDWNGMKWNEI